MKLATQTVLSGPQFMMVRPSRNNLHEFVAEENTCFFDICLPNYTADSMRRITYFKAIAPENAAAAETNLDYSSDSLNTTFGVDPTTVADSTLNLSKKVEGLSFIAYDSTPPKLPVDFEIAEVDYRGEMK